MAELYSQYASGTQWTAGAMTGSIMGVSGINPMVDRLNSITPSNSFISGTAVVVHASGNSTFSGKTSYWSCIGYNFNTRYHQIANYDEYHIIDGKLIVDEDGIICLTPVVGIPNGAVVTGAIVYGSEADETWYLERMDLSTATESSMATDNFNSEDTSISNATIDNSTYAYSFKTTTLDDTDEIYGAKITYTEP